MTDLFLQSYSRLLEELHGDDPWSIIEDSGFLDLLVAEEDGGAGLSLEQFFPLAVETGRKVAPVDILAAIARRVSDPIPYPLATIFVAAEMAGVMTAIQALTVEYASTRKQFGREIGRFQAVQQQLAVLAEQVLVAHMAAEMAFVGRPADLSERRAAVAKICCNRAASKVAAIAHAVHGAIGVSEEYALHRYTNRLRALGMQQGGEAGWARRLGEWVFASTDDITTMARCL